MQQQLETATHQATYWIRDVDPTEPITVQLTNPHYKDYICPARELVPAQIRLLPSNHTSVKADTVLYLKYIESNDAIKIVSNLAFNEKGEKSTIIAQIPARPDSFGFSKGVAGMIEVPAQTNEIQFILEICEQGKIKSIKEWCQENKCSASLHMTIVENRKLFKISK